MELENFRKLFPQPTSKFPGKFSDISAFLRRKKLMTLRSKVSARILFEKVDIFRSDAISENGPIESWPYLLVKHTKFSTKRPFQLSQIHFFLPAGVNQQLPPVAGVFRASSSWNKVSRLANFRGNFRKPKISGLANFRKNFRKLLATPIRKPPPLQPALSLLLRIQGRRAGAPSPACERARRRPRVPWAAAGSREARRYARSDPAAARC